MSAVGPPAVVVRDAYENALGGIRLSQHAVPAATNTVVNSSPHPFSFCPFYGTHIPFSEATLDGLYPNHGVYVRAVIQVTDENLRNGYIVWEDA